MPSIFINLGRVALATPIANVILNNTYTLMNEIVMKQHQHDVCMASLAKSRMAFYLARCAVSLKSCLAEISATNNLLMEKTIQQRCYLLPNTINAERNINMNANHISQQFSSVRLARKSCETLSSSELMLLCTLRAGDFYRSGMEMQKDRWGKDPEQPTAQSKNMINMS